MPTNEPVPPEGEVVRPEFLKYRAAELWDEYAPALVEMGTLKPVDVPNFATWCVLMAEFEEVKAKMQASTIAQMRMLAASFGMDASARAKLGTGGGKKAPKDPAEGYFKTG
jgi:phage terminase small subunit